MNFKVLSSRGLTTGSSAKRLWIPDRGLPPLSGMTTIIFLMALSMPVFAQDTDKKGMPQLDPSTYPSQLFWLAVFFALFYVFMAFVAMPRLHRILDAREARIADDLGHATQASGEAEALKEELAARLTHSRDEARLLIGRATEEMRRVAAEREAHLAHELAEKIAAAESGIAAARSRAAGAITDIAAQLVAEMMPKLAAVGVDAAEARGAVERRER